MRFPRLIRLFCRAVTLARSKHTMNQVILPSYARVPKLTVFDLDYTLWPLWVDTHVEPPFKKLKDSRIVDRCMNEVVLYDDVPQILEMLKSEGFKMAVASRTSAISVAEQLLDVMELNKYFVAKEIYPGSKVTHFSKFRENLGISYAEMLFFDDEYRNITDLTKIGITALHVPNGMSLEALNVGLKMFSDKHSHR